MHDAPNFIAFRLDNLIVLVCSLHHDIKLKKHMLGRRCIPIFLLTFESTFDSLGSKCS